VTGLRLVVVTDDPTPPYEQLRRQIVDLIGSDAVTPGDRLPPVRQLAADLGLAVGTVGRAYRELEAAGLVTSRRGGGTRVARQPPADELPRERERLLRAHAEEYARRARMLGAADDDIAAALREALQPPGRGAGDGRSGASHPNEV